MTKSRVEKSVKLSVVIPARNEAENLGPTLLPLFQALTREKISHELLVIDDGSSDDTSEVLSKLKRGIPTLEWHKVEGPNHGFGIAVRTGLEKFSGDAVAILMADGSEDSEDLVKFFREFSKGQVDCVFGSRFMAASQINGYPIHKLLLNRLVNKGIQILFGLRYNDVTNAFKLYGREAIKGIQPILSPHFNLTVELPLKAIVRGYRYKVLPNRWLGRKAGHSKLRIKEMGSRYLFIILYCLCEKWLSRGDYKRDPARGECRVRKAA